MLSLKALITLVVATAVGIGAAVAAPVKGRIMAKHMIQTAEQTMALVQAELAQAGTGPGERLHTQERNQQPTQDRLQLQGPAQPALQNQERTKTREQAQAQQERQTQTQARERLQVDVGLELQVQEQERTQQRVGSEGEAGGPKGGGR